MTKTLKRTMYGLLAVAVLVTALPVAALAQTETDRPPRQDVELTDEERSDRLEALKERIAAQIERRLDALDRLSGRIADANHLSESHAASLLTDIGSAAVVLRAGIGAVATAETLEELRDIVPPIFETTLVFALLGPKTHAVIASDAIAAAPTRFEEFGAKLQTALEALAATGVDTTEAQADLDEMARLVADAAAAAGPIADAVVGLQPSDWPDPAQTALREAKATLEEARAELRQARDLGKSVIEFIRSNRPTDTV